MAWAQVKEHVREHNQKFTLTEVERLIYEGFNRVTPEVWKKLVVHVEEKIEDHYWERDGLSCTTRHEFIIHLGASSDDSSPSSGNSSSEESSCEEDC